MKGNYITPTGEIRNVIMFDELNKMAYVQLDSSRHQWFHEAEYLTWVKEGGETEDTGSEEIADAVIESVPEVFEEQTTEGLEHNPITEEPKKKAAKKSTTKKKTK